MSAMKSACGEYECPCHDELREVRSKILLVDQALRGVRLAGGDQNPLGWRDILGSLAIDAERAFKFPSPPKKQA